MRWTGRPRSDEATVPGEHVAAWAVAAVVLAVVGVAASVFRPLAPALAVGPTDLADFEEAVLRAVEAYRGPRVPLAVIGTTVPLVVAWAVAATAPGRAMVQRIAGDRPASVLRAVAVTVTVAVLASLAVLPAAAWSGVVRDGRWGFRTASAGAWLLDWTLRSAGRWLAIAVVTAALVIAVRRWPRSWPYRATVAGTVTAAVLVLLHPLVLLPIELPTEPMRGQDRTGSLAPVLEAAGSDLPLHVGLESERSTRVNAVATGLGPTARVVVYDNLLELPGPQVSSVVAHEIAHHEHRDLLRGVLLVGAALLPGSLVLRWVLARRWVWRSSGARAAGDPRVMAIALATVLTLEFVGQPVANLVSRRAEAAADARAVQLTGDPATQIASTRAFTVRELATPEPSTWITGLYRTHPSVGERIRQAVAIAERDGASVPEVETLRAAERERRHPAVEEGGP